ncbi:MAG: hypothetical protein K2P07_02570 [Lachnospiraceae bacterium]|nr:hypothetical protein [Lachnospiraceae bacterium]
MKIHFYGTGASEGVPAIFCRCGNCTKIRKMGGKNFRSRTSTRIDDDLMIDFSADVFDHMRYGGLDMSCIEYLVITHAHMDHFYPEELLHTAPPFAMPPQRKKLKVYGNEAVCHRLEKLGAERAADHLEVHPIRNFEEISIGNYSIKALPAKHDFAQECHLYIVRKNGKVLLYAHDTGYFPEETWETLEGEYFNGVVLDCTCCNGPTHFEGHMGFEDNIKVQKRMMENRMADSNTVFVANHFVHTYGPFQDEMEQAFQVYNFKAAYDGMEVEI